MHRVTITVDDELMRQLDERIARAGQANRSEAIRDLLRAGLQHAGPQHGDAAAPDGSAVAALVYVFDHSTRELPKRLASTFHDHHRLSVSTLHVHLDHERCLEVTVLKGAVADMRHFADGVIAERGVRHGQLVVLPGT